jgi:hypothetical protein
MFVKRDAIHTKNGETCQAAGSPKLHDAAQEPSCLPFYYNSS